MLSWDAPADDHGQAACRSDKRGLEAKSMVMMIHSLSFTCSPGAPAREEGARGEGHAWIAFGASEA